jgi:NitT/TauT family transport system ATP-binding protein
LRGVGKVYRTVSGDTTALTGVDLTVHDGECLVLLGPSGCGKTTLLRIMAGLEGHSSGRVEVDGRLVSPEQCEPTDEMAVVFQDANLFPWFRVDDNISLPLRLRGIAKPERRRRAEELCRLVGIHGFERRYPRELSGGMRQRAAIARALSYDPNILFMDEPFGALDAMTRDQMNTEIQRLWMERRFTLVLVTHSIQEAVFLGDRIVSMSARPGRVVEITEVPLARARSSETVATRDFQDLVFRLRRKLEEHA